MAMRNFKSTSNAAFTSLLIILASQTNYAGPDTMRASQNLTNQKQETSLQNFALSTASVTLGGVLAYKEQQNINDFISHHSKTIYSQTGIVEIKYQLSKENNKKHVIKLIDERIIALEKQLSKAQEELLFNSRLTQKTKSELTESMSKYKQMLSRLKTEKITYTSPQNYPPMMDFTQSFQLDDTVKNKTYWFHKDIVSKGGSILSQTTTPNLKSLEYFLNHAPHIVAHGDTLIAEIELSPEDSQKMLISQVDQDIKNLQSKQSNLSKDSTQSMKLKNQINELLIKRNDLIHSSYRGPLQKIYRQFEFNKNDSQQIIDLIHKSAEKETQVKSIKVIKRSDVKYLQLHKIKKMAGLAAVLGGFTYLGYEFASQKMRDDIQSEKIQTHIRLKTSQ